MDRWKKIKKKYGHIPAAALLFVLILPLCFALRENHKTAYDMVCFGDSILGEERGETSITALLEERLNLSVFNGALGGTSMSCRSERDRASDPSDCISMAKLSEAIALDDYYVQNAGITRCASMEYFPETVYGYQKIDFDRVKILIIEHGLNDYLSGVELDNPQEPYDVFTFGGALRTTLQNLKESYPDLRIILVTPTYCWIIDQEKSCNEVSYGGGVLEEYVNLELEIAAQFCVETVDCFHGSGIGGTGEFREWERWTRDGVHLNEDGRRLAAEFIAEFMEAEENLR